MEVQTLLFQCCALHKFHVNKDQNMRDQSRRVEVKKLHFVHSIHVLSGSPNKSWLHTCTCGACVIKTWRLGLWAPLVAHNEKEGAPDKENGRVACPKDKLSFKFFFLRGLFRIFCTVE